MRLASRPVVLGLAGGGLFLAALDAYVVVTLLPSMIADVGLTIDRFEQATPIVTGFLGGYVVAMPLLGAYSDARGRSPVYAACMAAFAVGGGGLVPLSLALAADLYQGSSRTLALGWVAGLQEAGSVFGPLYGASLAALVASAGGWRFVFWLNVPLATLCAAGLVIAARRSNAPPTSQTTSSVDWISAALLGLGLGLLVVALYPDDPDHRATSASLLPAGLASVIVLALYGWRQVRRLEPLVPRDLLRSRSFIGAAASNLLIGAALMVALVDVPLLGRLVFSLNQLDSG